MRAMLIPVLEGVLVSEQPAWKGLARDSVYPSSCLLAGLRHPCYLQLDFYLGVCSFCSLPQGHPSISQSVCDIS